MDDTHTTQKYTPTIDQAKWCGLNNVPTNTKLFVLLAKREAEGETMRKVLETYYVGIVYGTTDYTNKRHYVLRFKARWKDLIDQVCDDTEECDVE